MIDIYIISGFLGAGKTTLIEKLLSEAFAGQNVTLIENDFGEASVDAALLAGSGFQVKELNSGCICCTLSGDFVKSILEIIKQYKPSVIIIEPSGVGKLSDVEKACLDPHIASAAQIQRKITVVDVKRCMTYYENFGDFFDDQVKHADTVLLSRTEEFPGSIPQAEALISDLNSQSLILSSPWSSLPSNVILKGSPDHCRSHDDCCGHGCDHKLGNEDVHECGHTHGHGSCCGQNHNEHDHDKHGHDHEHNHTHSGCSCGRTADDDFETVTLRFGRDVSLSHISAAMTQLDDQDSGIILRAKGILHTADGYLNIQYVPGDLKMEGTQAQGDSLCFIGRNLAAEKLARLFLKG